MTTAKKKPIKKKTTKKKAVLPTTRTFNKKEIVFKAMCRALALENWKGVEALFLLDACSGRMDLFTKDFGNVLEAWKKQWAKKNKFNTDVHKAMFDMLGDIRAMKKDVAEIQASQLDT